MDISTESSASLLEIIKDVYEQLPFNQYLGLRISSLDIGCAGFEFSMKQELVGNFVYGILHGGVISAVLDTVGGLVAFVSLLDRLDSEEEDHPVDRDEGAGDQQDEADEREDERPFP